MFQIWGRGRTVESPFFPFKGCTVCDCDNFIALIFCYLTFRLRVNFVSGPGRLMLQFAVCLPSYFCSGESVRNVYAFQVLATVFLKSKTSLLCRAVLDAIFAVYCRDPANYFILYNQNTLSSLSEKLPLKPPEVLSQ